MINTPPPLSVFLRPDLPEEALYGLAGRVTRALAQTTEADPAVLLVDFLTMFGNAAGPQPHTTFGVADHPGRLYTVAVGDAGAGRKGTAYEAIEALFRQADPDWADSRMLVGLQSAEAMIDRVADGHSSDCRLMIVETEFGRLMETMVRTGTLSAQLRNAYDGRPLQRARSDPDKSQTASHHHISLLGMITPEELLRQYTRLRSAGGLESRILFCYSAPTREVSPFSTTAALPENLAEQVRDALLGSRAAVMEWTDPISKHLLTLRGIQPSIEVPFSAGVREGWSLLRKQMPTVDRELGSFFERDSIQVIRLAVVYALTDQAREVGVAHMEAAIAMWTYCARSAEVIFGMPVGELPPQVSPHHRAKIIRYLHTRYPDWVKRDDIGTGLLKGNALAAETEMILADLEARSLIERRRIGTRGRPRDEYRLRPLSP